MNDSNVYPLLKAARGDVNDSNVYPLFKAARGEVDARDLVDHTLEDEHDDVNDWPTQCLARIDSVLSKNTPYAKMLAEICNIIEEWKQS